MEGVLGGGGGGGSCMSAVSKEDSLALSSEDSWCPHEPELELGLGLSLGGGGGGGGGGLGGGGGGGLKVQVQGAPRGKYARILTARDFPASSAAPSSSSSSSSSTLSKGNGNGTAGTKRTADSVAAAASPVVGWPPIGAHRMNSLVNQAKLPVTEGINSVPKTKSKYNAVEEINNGIVKRNDPVKENGHPRRSLFVKVNMDGIRIGRKVDLSAHNSYEALAQTLENMFFNSTTINSIRSSGEEHEKMVKTARQSKLLDGSSEFVLTYEDKDGDWMLVGDVPWGMFLSSVKRLRIMRTSEANGLGCKK